MSKTTARTLLLALTAALAALALAGTASAEQCTNCDTGGGGDTITAIRKLTVAGHPAGSTVTSSPAGINCGSTCTTTVVVSCDASACDWPAASTWTLTATGAPSGYSPHWTGCDSPGSATCTASAGDESKGADTATVSLTWADTQGPSVSTPAPGKVGPSGYDVSATATDNSGSIAGYQWAVDGAAQGATGSTLSLAALSSGAHSVTVRATDAAGNVSAPATRTVTVDRSAGVSTGSLPAYTNNATAPLSFTTASDVVATACSVNGGAFAACSSGWSGVSAASPDGTYTYVVRATDDVGNIGTSAPVSVVVDRTLPALAFTDGPSEGQQLSVRNASIAFSRTEANPAALDCSIDGKAASCAPGTPVGLSNLGDGQHAFAVHATDAAGNARTITRTFAVKVPESASGSDSGNGSGNATASGSASSSGSGVGGGGTGGSNTATGSTAGTSTTTTTTAASKAFAARITGAFARKGAQIRLTTLKATGLPAGSTVTVSCAGKSCAIKRTALKGSGTLDVLKALKKQITLRPGNVLTVRATAPSGESRTATWLARRGKAPKLTQS